MPLSHGQLRTLLAMLSPMRTPMWLTGGVAVDFLVGRWTREHNDLDLVALAPDRGALEDELGERGIRLAFDGGWNTHWSFDMEEGPSSNLEIVFLEPAKPDTGVLVIREGNPAGARPGRYPLLPGTLDTARRATLDGVRFRVCSAEGEWWGRHRSAALVPGRTLEPKIAHDLALLEALVTPERRRELLGTAMV